MKTNAMPRSVGKTFRKAWHASSPPADEPIATTGNVPLPPGFDLEPVLLARDEGGIGSLVLMDSLGAEQSQKVMTS